MPASKKTLAEHEEARVEAEKGQPENVAARALSHRAKADVDEFWKRLKIRFADAVKEEVATLLPHTKVHSHDRRGDWFSYPGYQSQEVEVIDMMAAILFYGYVQNLGSKRDFDLRTASKYDGNHETPTLEFMFRQRVYALAQELLHKEEEEDAG